MEGGFGLKVYISDPAAKSKRSDASNSTLFVGGLTQEAREQDVDDLFRAVSLWTHPALTVSTGSFGRSSLAGIQRIRCAKDLLLSRWPRRWADRLCHDTDLFEQDDARACLILQGTQLNGRFLKVEISDPHHANRRPVEP